LIRLSSDKCFLPDFTVKIHKATKITANGNAADRRETPDKSRHSLKFLILNSILRKKIFTVKFPLSITEI
jgi:hypothetical protein